MSEQERMKITIEDLEPEEEKPLVAEQPHRSKVGEAAATAGQAAAEGGKKAVVAAGSLARKVWDSDVRQKATDKLASGATAVGNRSAELVREKVASTVEEQAKATAAAVEARVREVDWKAEGQKAAVGGMRWLSRRLEALAERFSGSRESKQ